MTVPSEELQALLQTRGWYLTDAAVENLVKENNETDGNIIPDALHKTVNIVQQSVETIIRKTLDVDLKEIGAVQLVEDGSSGNSGQVKEVSVPCVLQLQKVCIISSSKEEVNEGESQVWPRVCRLSLTDGHTLCSAVTLEPLKGLSLNTPPGTKLLLTGAVEIHSNFLLLSNRNTTLLGGRVLDLLESWQETKEQEKVEQLDKMTSPMRDGSGPPPFVPFGQEISQEMLQLTKNSGFKSLTKAKKENVSEEEAEFRQRRKDAVAEALQIKMAEPYRDPGNCYLGNQPFPRNFAPPGFRPNAPAYRGHPGRGSHTGSSSTISDVQPQQPSQTSPKLPNSTYKSQGFEPPLCEPPPADFCNPGPLRGQPAFPTRYPSRPVSYHGASFNYNKPDFHQNQSAGFVGNRPPAERSRFRHPDQSYDLKNPGTGYNSEFLEHRHIANRNSEFDNPYVSGYNKSSHYSQGYRQGPGRDPFNFQNWRPYIQQPENFMTPPGGPFPYNGQPPPQQAFNMHGFRSSFRGAFSGPRGGPTPDYRMGGGYSGQGRSF